MNVLRKNIYQAFTKAGQAIVVLEGAENQKRENGQDFRRCQILPAIPQRFEWVNISNIIARVVFNAGEGSGRSP